MTNECVPGVPIKLADGVIRLTAPNPGLMTGPGTNTYLLGDQAVAVIDPGPPTQQHVDAIMHSASGDIRWILVTHTHPDHSPAAAMLAVETGAQLFGRLAPDGPHQDRTFRPDHAISDGETLQFNEVELQCIHTPGHASNHFCYLQMGLDWLYTGDHIMSGSTVVIDPPDGSMAEYVASLERLQNRGLQAIAPGHGALLNEPELVIQWIIDHRHERENKVIDALAANPRSTSSELVPIVYQEVSVHLHRLAERSLLAHLIKLQQESRASVSDDRWQMNETLSDVVESD